MTDAIANVADQSTQTSLGTAVASIMVYVDLDPGSDDRIKIAVDWAAKFGAVLIGVAGWLPGRKSEAGSPLKWNGPKTGLPEYWRSWINWPNAFAIWRAEPSGPWNGEEAFISHAK
jgi:hypothetical protein